ncbi:activator of HSP90 ATPase [Flavobacterium album]|uniref:Activator of HSP90 ATPase n=1 Tax=Flavobacterium album TaxID=2175091 RepID=A0A2S1QUT7_9FLAO|nr:SRPBCC family protein [Flavobacterium album]AWH84167.1 activator of HSP90 ATPase [Flavobacterium album]
MGKITVEATIAADRNKVWEYYINPEHITKWNFAADDWQCPSAENDMRVGGTYKARMEAKDGSFGFDFEAVYDEVVPKEKFTYSFGGRSCTVTFADLGEETRVTVVFDAENEHPEEFQKQGWQMILNNFKKYTESH